MSVIGNQSPPYYVQGIASCIANIRRDVRKLRAILCETGFDSADLRTMGLDVVDRVVDEVERRGGKA